MLIKVDNTKIIFVLCLLICYINVIIKLGRKKEKKGMSNMSKKNVYEIVTEQIIKKLEQNIVPWHKPWVSCPAVNWLTQKPYRGINQLLLDAGEYATWNQIQQAGGKVKKGSKFHLVTFFKVIKKKTKKGDEEVEVLDGERKEKVKTYPIMRYYRVFNIKDCEGIESKRKIKQFDHDPIEKAEEVVKRYSNKPNIVFSSDQAFYRSADDTVSIPSIAEHFTPQEFYSTLFHELIHSTGHPNRLNREGLKYASFGSEIYSKEELIAEIGSSMLCGYAGIEQHTIDNSVAYIQSWLKELKNDPYLIVQASNQAQKASEYILGEIEED